MDLASAVEPGSSVASIDLGRSHEGDLGAGPAAPPHEGIGDLQMAETETVRDVALHHVAADPPAVASPPFVPAVDFVHALPVPSVSGSSVTETVDATLSLAPAASEGDATAAPPTNPRRPEWPFFVPPRRRSDAWVTRGMWAPTSEPVLTAISSKASYSSDATLRPSLWSRTRPSKVT